MNTIIRNFKILRRYLYLSYQNQNSFQFDFVMRFFSSFIELSFYALFWALLARSHVFINGWGEEKIFLLFGFNVFSSAISKFFFGFRDFEYKIISGEFDVLMTRPINPVFLSVLEKFNFVNIILKFTVAFSVFIFGAIYFKLSLINIMAGLLISLLGTIGLEFLYGSISHLAFIFGRIYTIREILFLFRGSSNYPIDVYPNQFVWIMTYMIPLAFLSTIPTKIVVSEQDFLLSFLISLTLCSALFFILKLVNKKTLSMYQSTGS